MTVPFKNVLPWNNLIQEVANIVQHSYDGFTCLSPLITYYIIIVKCQNQEIYVDAILLANLWTTCQFLQFILDSSLFLLYRTTKFFSHVQIHVTATTIRIQKYFITSKKKAQQKLIISNSNPWQPLIYFSSLSFCHFESAL